MQTVASLVNWFERALARTFRHHRLNTTNGTRAYLASLLAGFAQSGPLTDFAPGRAWHRPLTAYWTDAALAVSRAGRQEALRRRGDIALFVCGVFPSYVSRRTTGHDFYLTMGRGAYAELAVASEGQESQRWSELAHGFPDFADALNMTVWGTRQEHSPLVLYERWLAGDGRLARSRLAEADISPLTDLPTSYVQH